jgi:hypothetical protein
MEHSEQTTMDRRTRGNIGIFGAISDILFPLSISELSCNYFDSPGFIVSILR